MNKKKNNKGFSLIELIIAIAILIILTGLLAPQFMKYIEKSREAKDMQTLDSVYTAVQGTLADEVAYEDFIDGSDDGLKDLTTGITLKALLKIDTPFVTELKSVLGSNANYKLGSKKAESGEVCVKVTYIKPDEDVPDTAAGTLSVSVYCGKGKFRSCRSSVVIVDYIYTHLHWELIIV